MIPKIKKAFVLMTLVLISASLFAQTATEVMIKADAKLKGNSSKGEMTIQIVRPKWKNEMQMTMWSKGNQYAVTLLTAPAKDAGTIFLKRGKEVYNWVPRIERLIKLPPNMMSQSWMGTDLTNDDLVKQSSSVTDYTHQFAGDSIIEGRNCWKLELTPKEGAAVVWGKIFTWIDKTDYLQLRTEFFDEDGVKINIMQASEIKLLGGKLLPSRMEIYPMDKPGNKTILIYNSLEFDLEITDDFFTTQQIKQLRP